MMLLYRMPGLGPGVDFKGPGPFLWLLVITLCSAAVPVCSRSRAPVHHLAPPDDVAVTKLSQHCVRIYWNLRHYHTDAAFTRVTLAPRSEKYKIMEDFPVPEYTGTFPGLRDGVYEVSLQAGDRNGEVGESGPLVQFNLVPTLQTSVEFPAPANQTIDWSRAPNGGGGAATEEIVIVCLCILFWIVAIVWFFAKWAKIRVIEPRYFDYKFLMRYDKAFALRNTVISAAASSVPRRSIGGRSVTGGCGGPGERVGRCSFSAASMRNGGSFGGDEFDQLPGLAFPNYAARRPSCLPGVRKNSRRPSEVRIHLNELFEMHDGRLKLARDSISSV